MTRAVGVEREPGPLAAEWESLADRAGATPFVRPGWIAAWLRAFGTDATALVTVRRDGRLTAVLPLERRGRTLAATTNFETFAFEIVAETDDDAREAVEHALELGAARVTLDQVDRERDVDAFRHAASGRPTLEQVRERSPYVATTGGFEEYAKRVGSKLFADVRRRRRRLEDEGEVAIEVVTDPGERLAALLDEGYRLEGSGWKTSEGTSIAVRPDARRYYDDVAKWAAERGVLRLCFVRVAGTAVAFQLGIEDGAYYFCKGGYDPAYHRFAPGKQLVAHMIERTFELGLDSFEFLGADEAWKLEWTDTVRERRRLDAFAPTYAGRALWAAERWGRPAARRLGVRRALGALRR